MRNLYELKCDDGIICLMFGDDCETAFNRKTTELSHCMHDGIYTVDSAFYYDAKSKTIEVTHSWRDPNDESYYRLYFSMLREFDGNNRIDSMEEWLSWRVSLKERPTMEEVMKERPTMEEVMKDNPAYAEAMDERRRLDAGEVIVKSIRVGENQ